MDTQHSKDHTQNTVNMRNCTEELINELHKNIDTVNQIIIASIGKVKESKLSEELTSQLDRYGEVSNSLCLINGSCGIEEKKSGFITKMSAKMNVEMGTLTDSSDEHIAQMVIENVTMCITDTIRLVRDYENTNCSEEVLSIARSLVSFQEKSVEKLKSFL